MLSAVLQTDIAIKVSIQIKELYHIGASLKDLGKKWFAFSKMSDLLPDLLAKLPE